MALDFDTLSQIAERFLSENFEKVLSVRTVHVTTTHFESEMVYMVDCVAQTGDGSARAMPGGARIEVLITKDGEVVCLHERGLHGSQGGPKALGPRRRLR